MRKLLLMVTVVGLAIQVNAQKISSSKVPAPAKAAFRNAYPTISHISWETENGNFEGNWKVNGKDLSALFTPDGKFAGSETDINPSLLPEAAREYLAKHENGKIKEISLNKDANGNTTYEADLKEGILIFDDAGRFIKKGEREEGEKGKSNDKD